MFGFQNKTALVTGAAQGIGFGIAMELARAGCRIVIADRDIEKARGAAETIKQVCPSEAIAVDVTDPASVQACVRQAIKACSHIHILVNNAGIFQSKLGLELTDEEFNHCVDVNLTGAWRMTQAVVPHFQANGGGRIVNIASVGARRGVDFAPAYCASKAGLTNLTQSLAEALGRHNITVNSVCPGAVSTAMQDEIKSLQSALGPDASRQVVRPLAGPLTAADIGYAVAFFASDYARNITGQALNVDCGFLMN